MEVLLLMQKVTIELTLLVKDEDAEEALVSLRQLIKEHVKRFIPTKAFANMANLEARIEDYYG